MAAVPWSPSHRVPDDGLAAWTDPWPSATPHPPLAGGLEVSLVEWRADWARVRCDNGWETWVDGRRLVPLATTNSRRWRLGRPAATAMVAVAAVAVTAGLVVSSGDGDEGATPSTDGGHGVELRVPEGWVASADGLTAARDRADLTAKVPAGPRVRAIPSLSPPSAESPGLPGPAASEPPLEPLGEPEALEVRGRRVVAISVRHHVGGGPVVRRYLGGPSPTGVPVLFVLEAPESQYDQHAAVLATVPGWAG